MSCYPKAWESVIGCYDAARGQRVMVPITDLKAVIACTGRPTPAGLVLETGRRFAIVDRDTLLALVIEHGEETCSIAEAERADH